MAQRNPHSYTGPRQLAQPGRNLFLDRSEKGSHAQRFLISAGRPTAPAWLSVALRAVSIALQLELHPPRSPCPSGQNCRQTAGSRSLTEYVTVISNVSSKLAKNRAVSPVPQPTSRTLPWISPASRSRAKWGCGPSISQGGLPR